MHASDKNNYLFSIGWKQGDKELTDQEIQDACDAINAAKQADKQAVMTKLGLTADEVKALLS